MEYKEGDTYHYDDKDWIISMLTNQWILINRGNLSKVVYFGGLHLYDGEADNSRGERNEAN